MVHNNFHRLCYSFIKLDRIIELIAFFIVSLMHRDCYCSVALPHGAVGWSALCDCGIS